MVFLDLAWAPFLDATLLQEYEETSCTPVLARAASMADSGIEQSGYIDIKQPPKVKGRKLKSWKKKWVVLHEMSIPAAGKAAAKVDVYSDEKTAAKCPSDKHTFILEYVTQIQAAKSKTHAHAFEIVENDPVLLMAGHTELESQTWISAFRKIFWPQEIEEHCYNVTIVQNENAKKLSLEGEYAMNITPEVIGIESESHNSYEWSLSMLKRFHMDAHPEIKEKKVLIIECGPRSECGEATFLFQAEDVASILSSIKKNIFTAINMKKCATSATSTKPNTEKRWRNSVASKTSSIDDRPRSGTLSSIHSSEQRFRDLLDPPMPESKRKRLASSSSDPRFSGSDTTSIQSSNTQPSMPSPDIVADFHTKKRHSVTFDTPVDLTRKEPTDILSLPNDSMANEDEEESEYNRVVLNTPKTPSHNIITTFTIAQPGYQTKLLLDDKGYSHVSFKDKTPVVESDKSRSPSNISSQSSMSVRSASVGSRDSGIQYHTTEQNEQQEKGTASKRSTNSFDSAVSTSSATEAVEMDTIISTPSKLTVAIEAVEVDSAGNVIDINTGDNGIYQDVSIDEENVCSNGTVKKTPKLLKSNSTGDFRRDENEYEDLEKYQKGKKDIWKHLGIDPSIDPTSVPPALPERPSSSKMKRKFQNQDRKLFTLPFARNKPKKNKEVAVSTSSSSDSDTESMKDNKNNADLTVKNWPLGNNSVIVGNNEIYQPVAIQRYLNDNDDNPAQTVRERSSSLNLNMSMSLKRASLKIGRSKNKAEKESAMWKHNRNASMNVEVLQRMNDKSADTNLKKRVEMALQNMPLGGSVFESLSESKEKDLDILRNRSGSEHSASPSEEEPIYAEVGPCSKQTEGVTDNPFPHIEPWKAHEDQNSFLNRTHYENDDSMDNSKSGDFLNQGFVTSENNNTELKPQIVSSESEAVLIDFSDQDNNNTDRETNDKQSSAVDIFKMEFDPLFSAPTLGHVTQTSSSTNEIVDIFHLGVFTPQPMNRENSVCLSNNMQKVVELTTESELDVTQDETNIEYTDTVNETIYMDMTQCKNESIYVMPSTVKK